MEGSLLPGTVEKVNEYALRILNGEDPESVLSGADAFRPLVESAVADYQEKKKAELESKESEGEMVPERTQELVITEEKITERQKEDEEKIQAIREDLVAVTDPLAHMEAYEGAGEDHKQGVQIYNTLMDIGKGLSEGMKEAFDPKVQQYLDEIRSGKSKEYVLGGASKSMVDAVEKELAKNIKEGTVEQKGNNIEKTKDFESLSADDIAAFLKTLELVPNAPEGYTGKVYMFMINPSILKTSTYVDLEVGNSIYYENEKREAVIGKIVSKGRAGDVGIQKADGSIINTLPSLASIYKIENLKKAYTESLKK